MYIIILFSSNDKLYHFEHSNRPEQGIHEYENIEQALENITKGFKENGDIRELAEIDNIPNGLSFKEFNNYVNKFEQKELNQRKLS